MRDAITGADVTGRRLAARRLCAAPAQPFGASRTGASDKMRRRHFADSDGGV